MKLIPIIVNNAKIYFIQIQHQELAKKELSKIAKNIALIINAQNVNQVTTLII
jgi:hypothetical protein